MDVSLAYRDDTFAEWTEMAHERVPRKLKCTFTSPKVGFLDDSVDGVLIWVPGMWEDWLYDSQTYSLFRSIHDSHCSLY